MTEQERTHTSKFLSLVLRHQPDTIGLTLDEAGWVDIAVLIQQMAFHNHPLTRNELEELVASNSKQRFAFNDDHTRIRASQGHSIAVELDLPIQDPPQYLYHGTVSKFLAAIRVHGLQKMSRQHVHLSADIDTAKLVGSRRGQPVILRIRSAAMQAKGHNFYLSENGVWLTDEVPVSYIDFNFA